MLHFRQYRLSLRFLYISLIQMVMGRKVKRHQYAQVAYPSKDGVEVRPARRMSLRKLICLHLGHLLKCKVDSNPQVMHS